MNLRPTKFAQEVAQAIITYLLGLCVIFFVGFFATKDILIALFYVGGLVLLWCAFGPTRKE